MYADPDRELKQIELEKARLELEELRAEIAKTHAETEETKADTQKQSFKGLAALALHLGERPERKTARAASGV